MGSITPSIYGLVSTLKSQNWSDAQKLQARINIGLETFESVSSNIQNYPHSINRLNDLVSSIVYTTPNGLITKTLIYIGDTLTSIVLSGATPNGIALTKTLTYTDNELTGVAYS